MALLGQGDPRWKVQDRKDGKNVNAWHWTEKNCTKWSQDKLKELFINLVVCDVGECKIVEVSKTSGEITYCNRKRKDLFFYDLEIVLKWEGKLEKVVKGEVKFNLSEDTPISETKFRFTTTTKGESSDRLKEPISQQAPLKIRETLNVFFDKLREQFSEVVAEFIPTPTFDGVPIELVPELSPNHSNPNLSISNSDSTNSNSPVNASNNSNQEQQPPKKPSISTKSLTEKLSFEAPAAELFECFLDPQRLSAFTQSSVDIDRSVGGKFSLFGGQIHGLISSFNSPQKIVQKWRFRDWPEEHYSVVTITLEPSNRGTQLTLKQTGIPSSDFDRTQSGWKTHFWTRIRGTFGFNFKEL